MFNFTNHAKKRQKCKKSICAPNLKNIYAKKDAKKRMQQRCNRHMWCTINYVNFQTTIGKSYAPPVLTRGGTTIGAVRSETFNAPFRKYTPDDWYRRNQGTFLKDGPIPC